MGGDGDDAAEGVSGSRVSVGEAEEEGLGARCGDGGVGLYDQALKALAERSPFEEVAVSRVSTLPVGLSDFVSRCTHHQSRKKQKKSHSEAGAKSSAAALSRVSNIWTETEEYFRPVTSSDVENLVVQSSIDRLCTGSYFNIPSLRAIVDNSVGNVAASGITEVGVEGGSNSMVNAKDGGSVDEEQVVAVDSREDKTLSLAESELLKEQPSSSSVGSGLEWLLGSRNRVFITSDRPSKKRKVSGKDAGLERLCVVRPSEGEGQSLAMCHLCCLGDLGEEFNRLMVCDSCKVVVHQKCYGVQEVPVGLWLCSWCNYNNSLKNGAVGAESLQRPCLLCPKLGGALKPVRMHSSGSENGVHVSFAHLFCSQWIAEVHIGDTKTMEPVLNVDGIKETRKNLVCCLCKLKYGACVRCSRGTCRTCFHPICARAAKYRMEIWGKIGCENVELRAFCSRHSKFDDNGHAEQSQDFSADFSRISSVSLHSPSIIMATMPNNMKLEHGNGEENKLYAGTLVADPDKLGNNEVSHEGNELVTESNTRLRSNFGDAEPPLSMEISSNANICDANPSKSLDIVQAFKKLVARGKAVVRDVALEIGISSDLLDASLEGDQPFSNELQSKILKWLQNHAYLGTLVPNLKRRANLSATLGVKVPNGQDAVAAASCDKSDTCTVRAISPKRKKHKIRILKDNKGARSATESDVRHNDNGMVIDDINANSVFSNQESNKAADSDTFLSYHGNSAFEAKGGRDEVLGEWSRDQDLSSSMALSYGPNGGLSKANICENNQMDMKGSCIESSLANSNGGIPYSASGLVTSTQLFIAEDLASSAHIHTIVIKRLAQFKNGVLLNEGNSCHYDQQENSLEVAFPASTCCGDQDCHPHGSGVNLTSNTVKTDALDHISKMEILRLSPEDEVEGQLIYFQNKLLDCAVATKSNCDKLIFKLVRGLPQEREDIRKQRWDSVLVNQYLCQLREVKKQGRKEKRHKEAQAVLAAATAAAASSSRGPSLRKDANDEDAPQEVFLKANAATGRHSSLMPRAKETLSRLAVVRPSIEKRSENSQSMGLSKDRSQVCDICRRPETMLNPILVCSNCKVAVHLVCYRNVKDHVGPWYCEVCEELLLSRTPRAPSVTSQGNAGTDMHCGLCGGSSGAFRKSTDGQWVHAFCAEWLLETTFKKGHPNLVEGMEALSKGQDVCCVCSRNVGVCIKCNYGNCQSTFHPSCAQNAGFHMHVKTAVGRLQHKAYCERHSLEQREKAETLQHGAEELKTIKQIRVELERLRLLCERIIKREKLKRELVLCSHDILASKRDSVAFSVLVRSPFFLPDVSSESATTSLRGHLDDNKSFTEAIQRSDDITIDTAISCKRRVMPPVAMDIDQKTDDSSTSQRTYTRRSTDRTPFSGKQISHKPAPTAFQSRSDDSETILKSRKHTETFEKEVVMTSYQASLKNQRLPKGFAYVPVVSLPKEKPNSCKPGSREPPEPDG
ncbi:hypothetical protein Syun_030732 [Stephania yunnanensis]|uniref:Uncharacterized protein n=1 Tax=Stephania yunnanensis TaxID=152371 RepID=A0AAP0DVJ5_9MAGN